MDKVRQWLRSLGALLIAWGTPAKAPMPYDYHTPSVGEVASLRALFVRDMTHPSPAVSSAVQNAFVTRGLPMANYAMDFNLRDRGEVYNVLRIAGEHLGMDRGLKTVADVIRVLDEVV